MKKVLIVNKSFETGGIQSSMVNMANALVHHYQVDLFIYNPQGPMKSRLDSRVHILDSSWRFQVMGMTLGQTLQSRNLKYISFKVFISLWTKLFNNQYPIELAIKHHPCMKGYDLAIAFHQEQRKKSVLSGFTRVVSRLTDAKNKIAWIHFDSSTIDLDHSYNEPFYKKMDKIVCVSQSVMNNFAMANPALADKVDYCYNFFDYENLILKSHMEQDIAYPKEKFICFSACRLTEEKALVRAIKALATVFRENRDVVWYIAGDGVERENIEQTIIEEHLSESIVLIGNQSNPYSYMRNANLIMNVSYHEAAPMVYFEAKALGVPVFATKTSSAEELLHDGKDSFVCENTDIGIHKKFVEIINDRRQVDDAREFLKTCLINNQESLKKIMIFME